MLFQPINHQLALDWRAINYLGGNLIFCHDFAGGSATAVACSLRTPLAISKEASLLAHENLLDLILI